jgi:hypothetical protein
VKGYRIVGTLRPGAKQSFAFRKTLAEALELQDQWERQRVHGAAATRPKITSLTIAQLRDAESAIAIGKDSGITMVDAMRLVMDFGAPRLKDIQKALILAEDSPFSIADAVRFATSQKLNTCKTEVMAYEAGLVQYVQENTNEGSTAHRARTVQRAKQFGRYLPAGVMIHEITPEQVKAWITKTTTKDGKIVKKSWNNCTDVSKVFEFFQQKHWCHANPFSDIKRYTTKEMGGGLKERLEVETCEELMAYLEEHHPKWVTYFVLTLFLGIRPDLRTGEIWELAQAIKRHGVAAYYRNGHLWLTAGITKEREPRTVRVMPNVVEWLEAYPMTPESICPGDYKDEDISEIRKRFKIPHDGLRHTAISAFMAAGNSYDLAADQHGNSENIIRHHYLHRMVKEESDRFYAIRPKKVRNQ